MAAWVTLLLLGFLLPRICIGQDTSFVPCYGAINTSLEGILVGVTATPLEGDSCSWKVSYQFRQLQKDLTTLIKLSSIVLDLGTSDQDVINQYGCWSGCVDDPSFDSSYSTLSFPWRFDFKHSSCACMNSSYTFDIALSGVTLQWGELGLVSALGESMVCPTIVFSECTTSSDRIDMSGVCPLDNPLGTVDPATDDCTNTTAPSSSPVSAAGDGGMSGGAIAGVVVGVVSGVVIVGGVAGAAVGTVGYLLWKGAHQPVTTSTLAPTEAHDFQLHMGMDNPVYVSPSNIVENAAYQAPI